MKGLKLTPGATSVLHGLARSTYDVVDALATLAGENDGRRIDASEVRLALAELDASRLLRGFDGRKTTPRRLVSALLEADAPLRATELDELADVSARSRRDHLADLEEIGLVVDTDHGLRLDLSFDGTGEGEHAERLTDRYPTNVVDPETSPQRHAAAKILRVGHEHYGPDGPATSVGWPYTGVTWSPDLRELAHPEPYLSTILPALWSIEATEYRDNPDVAAPSRERDARAGPRLDQAPLEDVATS
jgi:hypothetical protein